MIKIKNKEYKFKLGFKALNSFEKETGKSVSSLGDNVMLGMIIDLAFHAITSQGDKITKDFIVDAIDEDIALLDVLNAAIAKDMETFSLLGAEAKK